MTPDLARALDEAEILKVRRIWAFSRDLGDWERLRACFHPGATITVAWYSGPAEGFVARSQAMRGTLRPEEHHKHWLGNMRAEVVGFRAVAETDAMVLIREFMDGHLFDYCCWLRFYDLLEKRDGVWRLSKASCIYEKDRYDSVVPGAVPPSFYEQIALAGSEAGFAFMRFRQVKKGRAVPASIVVAGTRQEDALREEGRAWLARSPG
jgi:SnoaL-like protein